jgi:hypothetical protein
MGQGDPGGEHQGGMIRSHSEYSVTPDDRQIPIGSMTAVVIFDRQNSELPLAHFRLAPIVLQNYFERSSTQY